ncbi:DUF2452 domain-containing protein [Arundinibacter roseus]|uniref:DUF2452 domain-containing protein n=1 Tax=Arundinibacter roseus TaxID=2070510 RepID=A0A4R4KKC6_9BACT|nr:DUF2452 domain-containing protein [Arundinibacter roseus]TDB67051.1 DUF2452 domain-containing protein [Arundinibacter roseus]
MENQELVNEKIAQNPGLMEYAHTAGGAVIRPEDMGKVKSRSLLAMRQQTDIQLAQLYKQMQLLAEQANHIKNRVEVSERIYSAQMSFEPVVGESYFLYEKHDGCDVLSLVAPAEWGRKRPFKTCLARVRMLADHTWEVENLEDFAPADA